MKVGITVESQKIIYVTKTTHFFIQTFSISIASLAFIHHFFCNSLSNSTQINFFPLHMAYTLLKQDNWKMVAIKLLRQGCSSRRLAVLTGTVHVVSLHCRLHSHCAPLSGIVGFTALHTTVIKRRKNFSVCDLWHLEKIFMGLSKTYQFTLNIWTVWQTYVQSKNKSKELVNFQIRFEKKRKQKLLSDTKTQKLIKWMKCCQTFGKNYLHRKIHWI